jgi:integrase
VEQGSEVVTLHIEENLQGARLWVRRLKNGLSVEHPIAGDELRAIKRYLTTRRDQLPWLFLSERGQQRVEPSGRTSSVHALFRHGEEW